MKARLQALIDDDRRSARNDSDDDNNDKLDGGNSGDERGQTAKRPRAKCIFWQELVEEIKAKGSRAVVGVSGQYASFERTQPG